MNDITPIQKIKFSLHTEAMAWLRYCKQLPIVTTEVGNFSADVLGISFDTSIEVEVKKSYSDFLADFSNKKAKHYCYFGQPRESFADYEKDDRPFSWKPNFFFFCVELEIADRCKEYLDKYKHPAGLITREVAAKAPYGVGHGITYRRKPVRLHDHKPSEKVIRLAIARMSSQICGLSVRNDLAGYGHADKIEFFLKRKFNAFDPTVNSYEDLLYRAKCLATAMDDDWDKLNLNQQFKYIAGAYNIREIL